MTRGAVGPSAPRPRFPATIARPLATALAMALVLAGCLAGRGPDGSTSAAREGAPPGSGRPGDGAVEEAEAVGTAEAVGAVEAVDATEAVGVVGVDRAMAGASPGPERHEPVHVFRTGRRPKQVVFSPTGDLLIVPLLDDDGVDMISLATGRTIRARVPETAHHLGFVEAAVAADGRTFLVSQMTTGAIHRFSARGVYLRSYASGGRWSKVIAVSPTDRLIAVSNWLSDTVTLLDGANGAVVGVLHSDEATVPRGVAFTPDGRSLVVAYFGSGDVIRYSVATGRAAARTTIGGANRHVVVHPDGERLFVSNMAAGRVIVLALDDLRLLGQVKVDSNPNTIVLSPDGRRLYVSCRGPNDPVSYERRSPRDGSIYCIDAETLDVLEVIAAGNQPTGLAVSPDGTLIAGTNFQDDTVVVYRAPFHNDR